MKNNSTTLENYIGKSIFKIGWLATFVLICISLLDVSCSKNQDEQSPAITNSSIHRQKSQNSSVSFETFGTEHNLFLDFVAQMPEFNSKSGKQIFDWGSQYNFQILTNASMSTNWSEFETVYNYNESILSKSPNSAVMQLINDDRFSRDFYFVALDIFETLTKSTSPEDFQIRLDKIESNILDKYKVIYDNNTHLGNEAALFLGAIEIARASGQYWSDVEADPNHKWHSKLMNLSYNPSETNPAINAARLPRWIRAAGKDIGTFFSSGNCVNYPDPASGQYIYSYDLICAWQSASNSSSQVN